MFDVIKADLKIICGISKRKIQSVRKLISFLNLSAALFQHKICVYEVFAGIKIADN